MYRSSGSPLKHNGAVQVPSIKAIHGDNMHTIQFVHDAMCTSYRALNSGKRGSIQHCNRHCTCPHRDNRLQRALKTLQNKRELGANEQMRRWQHTNNSSYELLGNC